MKGSLLRSSGKCFSVQGSGSDGETWRKLGDIDASEGSPRRRLAWWRVFFVPLSCPAPRARPSALTLPPALVPSSSSCLGGCPCQPHQHQWQKAFCHRSLTLHLCPHPFQDPPLLTLAWFLVGARGVLISHMNRSAFSKGQSVSSFARQPASSSGRCPPHFLGPPHWRSLSGEPHTLPPLSRVPRRTHPSSSQSRRRGPRCALRTPWEETLAWGQVHQRHATAEFSTFAGMLSTAFSQHHLLGFEILNWNSITSTSFVHSDASLGPLDFTLQDVWL